jgi:hypothetical protein
MKNIKLVVPLISRLIRDVFVVNASPIAPNPLCDTISPSGRKEKNSKEKK